MDETIVLKWSERFGEPPTAWTFTEWCENHGYALPTADERFDDLWAQYTAYRRREFARGLEEEPRKPSE